MSYRYRLKGKREVFEVSCYEDVPGDAIDINPSNDEFLIDDEMVMTKKEMEKAVKWERRNKRLSMLWKYVKESLPIITAIAAIIAAVGALRGCDF